MSAATVPSAGRPLTSARQLQGSIPQLAGEIPASQPPAMFHVATALSAFILLLLPAIYFGLVGIVGWLTVTHLIYNFDLLAGPRINVFTIAIYLVLSFLGIVLFLFMIKPLFNWQREDDVVRTLTPAEQPRLFDYVGRLCDILKAPRPTQIDVDLRVNTSANPGYLGLFGQKLTLTLGLPLIHGLNLAQFTGVLAHELGHFTQTKSLRLTNWVRMVNLWFIRVVYERDWFDAKLDEWTESGPSIFQWLFGIARFFVWVTRRVLHLFMMLGHAASCLVARHSEFDADRYQTHTAGSAAFTATMHKIHILDLAHNATIDATEAMWRDKRLGDNLPRLVVAKAKQIPKEQIEALIRLMLAVKTRWHDTHPSIKDRLHHARSLKAPGITYDDRPARELFDGFEDLCRGQTLDLYRLRLGKDFSEKNLVATEIVVKAWTAQREAVKTLLRFFVNATLRTRPHLPLAEAGEAPADEPAAIAELKAAREKMVAQAAEASESVKQLDEIDSKLLMARHAVVLTKLRIGFEPAVYHVEDATVAGASRSVGRLEKEQSELLTKLAAFDRAARVRFTRAIQLAQLSHLAEKLSNRPGTPTPDRMRLLLSVSEALGESIGDIDALRQSMVSMSDMLQNIKLARTVPGFGDRVLSEAASMARTMAVIRTRFEKVPYPFDHISGASTIAQFLQEKEPDPQMIGDVTVATAEFLDRTDSVLVRTVSQLAVVAEEVESLLGLPRLPDAPEGDELKKAVEELEKAEEATGGAKAALASAWNGTVQIATSAGMLVIVAAAVWAMGWLAQAAPSMVKERKQQRVMEYHRLPSYQPTNPNPHLPQPWNPNDPLKPKDAPKQYDPTKPYQPYQPYQPAQPSPSQPTYPKPGNYPRPTPTPPRPGNPGPSRPSPTPARPGPGR